MSCSGCLQICLWSVQHQLNSVTWSRVYWEERSGKDWLLSCKLWVELMQNIFRWNLMAWRQLISAWRVLFITKISCNYCLVSMWNWGTCLASNAVWHLRCIKCHQNHPPPFSWHKTIGDMFFYWRSLDFTSETGPEVKDILFLRVK